MNEWELNGWELNLKKYKKGGGGGRGGDSMGWKGKKGGEPNESHSTFILSSLYKYNYEYCSINSQRSEKKFCNYFSPVFCNSSSI